MTNQTKESFLLYKPFYEPTRNLTKEQKGDLWDAVFEYQIDKKEPETTSTIYPFFLFFKNQFRLDEQKYQSIIDRNKSNGSKGGRPKKDRTQPNPENPVGFSKPKKAYKDKDNDKDLINAQFEEFWNLYGKKLSRPKAEQKFIQALKRDSFENIINGLRVFVRNRGDDSKYWKYPDSWLHNECWKDEYNNTQKTSGFDASRYSHIK